MRHAILLLPLTMVLSSAPLRADPIPHLGFLIGVGDRVSQMAQAPDGRIFAPLQDYGNVVVLDETGGFIALVSGPRLDQPTGVVLDDSMNVYVCEQHANTITKYSPGYVPVKTWGGAGTSPGHLLLPTNLAFSPDYSKLYVTELWGGRVSVFDRNGAFLFSFASQGSAAGQLDYPFGIVVEPVTGDLFIANQVNHRVDRWTGDGHYLSSFGSYGTALGQFDLPVGLGRDPVTGDLYVTDQLNNRIQKFRADGTPVLQFGNGQLSNPWSVFVTHSGNIWVGDTYHYRIAVYLDSGVVAAGTTSWGALKAMYR